MKSKKILIAALSLLCAGAAWAIPAKRLVYTMVQPDGTTVQLTKAGDEFCHYYLTDDDQMVIGHSGGGFYFAQVSAEGLLEPSSVLASNSASRTPAQQTFVKGLSPDKLSEAAIAQRLRSPMHPANRMASRAEDGDAEAQEPQAPYESWGIGKFSYTKYPTTGEVRALVVLVEYKDVKFSLPDDQTSDYFTRMLNEPGFSDLNGTGSARDFFLDASTGQFSPTFDVLGPITLPYNRSYYGGNDAWGNDKHPERMITHAADSLYANGFDFSPYDNDGDGVVDNLFVFYAGEGEADTRLEDTVWPHSWNVSYATGGKGHMVGDYYIDSYACSCELIEGASLDGVGTFVHEYSHVLGLPDLYDTVAQQGNYTPGSYDTLDVGPYNNNSRTPPTYSAFERNALGWITCEVIEGDADFDLMLEHLLTSNKAYILPTGKKNEFFLFENRQKEGWDAYIPGHGMLVWHIDYDRNKWDNNAPNNNKDHQRVDIIEANGAYGGSAIYHKRYPFPGTKNITELSFDTTPSLQTWKGEDLGYAFTDIAESEDGIITAKVTFTAGIDDVMADADGQTQYYNLQGLRVERPTPGKVYIAVSGGQARKIRK